MSLQIERFFMPCVRVRDYIHTWGEGVGDSPGVWVRAPHNNSHRITQT